MKLVALLVATLLPVVSQASTKFDIVKILDGKTRDCSTEADTNARSGAYIITSAEGSVLNGKMSIALNYRSVACAKTANGFEWQDISPTQVFTFMDHGDKIEMWNERPEMVLLRNNTILDLVALNDKAATGALNFSVDVKAPKGTYNFSFEVALRSFGFYRINGGENKPLGRTMGGSFTLNGTFEVDANGTGLIHFN